MAGFLLGPPSVLSLPGCPEASHGGGTQRLSASKVLSPFYFILARHSLICTQRLSASKVLSLYAVQQSGMNFGYSTPFGIKGTFTWVEFWRHKLTPEGTQRLSASKVLSHNQCSQKKCCRERAQRLSASKVLSHRRLKL